MRSYLKDNDISIKNGTDVNAVMRDMMSVILEDVLSFSMVFCVLLLMLSLFVPSTLKSLFFHFFSACIMPFHDYFCGWVLSGGSMLCVAVFAHKSAPLQYNRAHRIVFYTL